MFNSNVVTSFLGSTVRAGASPAVRNPVEPRATPLPGDSLGKSAATSAAGQVGNAANQLGSSVGKLNELMQDVRRELNFSVDDATGRTVIQVVDSTTHEIVRQIPPAEVLVLIRNLEQGGQRSLLMDVEA